VRIALYGYTVIYVLFALWVVVEGLKDRDPLWKPIIDAVLFVLGLLGIVFYLANFRSEPLVLTWRIVSVALVMAHIIVNLYDRHRILSGKDSDISRPSELAILATDLFTVVMMAPAIIVNLLYAYS
jgi:hypothetical protein